MTQNRHQNRGNTVTTPPTVEPVTADELRAHLNGVTDLDAVLEGLITEAREQIENTTGMAMISQTCLLAIDRWPGAREPWWDGVRQLSISELAGTPGWLTLPRYPLASVEAVTTYDESSNATVIDVDATFDVDAVQMPGRLALRTGKTWPVALRHINAIAISYIAGYGDTAADVPSPIKRAVKQLAAYAYGHRGDGCDMAEAYHASGAAAAVSGYGLVRI